MPIKCIVLPIIALLMIWIASGTVYSQDRQVIIHRDRSGNYVGSTHIEKHGNRKTATFRDRSGNYLGQAQKDNNTITYRDRSGNFIGSSRVLTKPKEKE